MAFLKEVKGRINSVNSTRKITSAMKMVASAKLHKAQAAIGNMLLYQDKLNKMLASFLDDEQLTIGSPYTEQRSLKRVAIVVCSSNASLCGGFNANISKKLTELLSAYAYLGKEQIMLFPIGRKVAETVKQLGYEIQDNYEQLAEHPSYTEAAVLASHLMGMFARKEIDRVELLYHHFRTTSSQVLMQEVYLPLNLSGVDSGDKKNTGGYIVEPSPRELLLELLPKVLRMKIFTVLLDSNASEHAARMMSMQTATDNADELLQILNVTYNNTRQQAITAELLDIIGGSLR